jgi:hypothetical protein
MQIETDAQVTLFIRDRITGRLVFNSKAIEALGLNPKELAQRGYPVDSKVTSQADSAAATSRPIAPGAKCGNS